MVSAHGAVWCRPMVPYGDGPWCRTAYSLLATFTNFYYFYQFLLATFTNFYYFYQLLLATFTNFYLPTFISYFYQLLLLLLATFTIFINYFYYLLTLGACARGLQYSLCVCVCVCVSVPRLLPSNRAHTTKWTHQHAFRQFFLVFNSRICLRYPRSRDRALFTVIL